MIWRQERRKGERCGDQGIGLPHRGSYQSEQDALEHALDKKTVGLVKIRMAIGLGTGSTSSLACSENISDRRRLHSTEMGTCEVEYLITEQKILSSFLMILHHTS
ncbi:uncharacterized protein [Elaeis guineensis]|uniref:uncharacterized protein n=1 Tax=Elaeis guineensis var. tenera TaxID=51953 RepID=UPI003C6DB541